MPHKTTGQGAELSPILTDEPGVVVPHLRRRAFRLVTVLTVWTLVCAGGGALFTYTVLHDQVADARGELDRLDEQRRANAARIEQTRRDLCVITEPIEPKDPAVEALRRRYGCPAAPTPSRSTAPKRATTPADAPTAPAARSPRPRRPAAPREGVTGPTTPPRPSPTTAPPPQAPTPPAGGLLCVPLLRLCL